MNGDNLPYQSLTVVPFTAITSEWGNGIGDNLLALAGGTGFDAGAIDSPALANNSVSQIRLSAIENTDLWNGSAITVSTWTDLKANQNFTVSGPTSVIAINIVGSVSIGGGSAGSTSSRIIVDSGGTPITRYLGAQNIQAVAAYTNPLSGSGTVWITGLSAGVHTIKTQVYTAATSSLMYLRASSLPNNEFLATYVAEFKK